MPGLIPLAGGGNVLVDAGDLPVLALHKWHALRNGSRVYARSSIKVDGRFRTVLMHRLLMAPAPTALVDHRDGDGLNNTRANLRICNARQNSVNRPPRGSSGFAGVRRGSSGWIASVARDGVEIHLGTYASREEAAQVYDAAALHVHGDFARLNGTPDLAALGRVIQGKREAIARLEREIALLARTV